MCNVISVHKSCNPVCDSRVFTSENVVLGE
jgi:hypothetical protein